MSFLCVIRASFTLHSFISIIFMFQRGEQYIIFQDSLLNWTTESWSHFLIYYCLYTFLMNYFAFWSKEMVSCDIIDFVFISQFKIVFSEAYRYVKIYITVLVVNQFIMTNVSHNKFVFHCDHVIYMNWYFCLTGIWVVMFTTIFSFCFHA